MDRRIGSIGGWDISHRIWWGSFKFGADWQAEDWGTLIRVYIGPYMIWTYDGARRKNAP